MAIKTTHRFAPPGAAYVHIPFCISKCHYCEFNSYSGMESAFDSYVCALVREIQSQACFAGDGLDTVYFGGGTPTLLSVQQLINIFSAIDTNLHINPNAEITVEANPGTLDDHKLVQLFEAKFNRISLGVQSLDDEFLSRIGRVHTAQQAVEAYRCARSVGFSNISIDLMFALPGQTIAHWKKTLDAAIDLNSEHISLYELSIEDGTRFAQMCADGKLDLPDEDAQLEMYELAIAKLIEAGFEHYEVSNFARAGFRSRHNQVYWRNEPYFGFGAGATSYVNGCRARKIASPVEYISTMDSNQSVIESSESLNDREYLAETIIQGLRMVDGIDLVQICEATGIDIRKEFSAQISHLMGRGLIEVSNNHLRVTHTGLLLLNDVSQAFLGD